MIIKTLNETGSGMKDSSHTSLLKIRSLDMDGDSRMLAINLLMRWKTIEPNSLSSLILYNPKKYCL